MPMPSGLIGLALVAFPGLGWSQRSEPAPRTFPDFVGTWMLDEQASTDRMSATPGAVVETTITPTEISGAE